MLQHLKQEANETYTENGAATYRSTQSDCLDLFATIGALRRQSEAETIARFTRAFAEDKDMAMKLLFYARDIRGGLGERKVFRVILKWLAHNHPDTVRKNLPYIAEYGRYDDLLVLLISPVERDMLQLIRQQLQQDMDALDKGEAVSLLGKWLPSVNASNADTVKAAKRIARSLGMDDKAYRQALTRLRAHIRILENNLREKDYTFDYEQQPSKALFKYRNAFTRNDGERYALFLNKVASGEAKLNASTLMPYEIITPFFRRKVSEEERKAINATWQSQPDFGGDENALVVIDGSGSMYGGGEPMPATVAMSLGIYFAQRNTGAFHNHFITFSENPQLVEIKGEDILDKVRYCCGYNEVANTDIQQVFELILNAAKRNRVPQEELPKKLYIVSDMEFDCCAKGADLTNFAYAHRLFKEAGYRLPDVVFWNVASRHRQQPVTMNEQGVALVSGCTPRLFSLIAGDDLAALTPYQIMLDILGSERYEKIAA